MDKAAAAPSCRSTSRIIGQRAIDAVQNRQKCIELIEPDADSNHLYGGTKMKTNMKRDLEDIPMAYFWYPFLAIVTMVVAAVTVVIKMV